VRRAIQKRDPLRLRSEPQRPAPRPAPGGKSASFRTELSRYTGTGRVEKKPMSIQRQSAYSFEDYLAVERECRDEKHE
jgi:hypothetical protein